MQLNLTPDSTKQPCSPSMGTAPTDAGSESVIDALRNQHLLLTIPSTSRRIIQ